MKILLINPPIRIWAQPNCFPQGLGYVAQALRKDHDVKILDINAHRLDWLDVSYKLEYQFEYDAIGITGLVTNYAYVERLINDVKSYASEVPIVIGGPLGSSIPEIMLRKAGADICVIGEGEETAVELFRGLEKDNFNWMMRGIVVKSSIGEIFHNTPRSPIRNISKLPLPAYDLFPTEIYAKNPVGSMNKAKWVDGEGSEGLYKSLNIVSSRSCAWSCLFCYHNYMGYQYRYRNAESLYKEIRALYYAYGVEFILMGDDTFVVNRKNVVEFCELMISSGMNEVIQWEAGARVDTVDRELLELCKKAGCTLIDYGIESGSQEMLDRLNKKISVADCHKAVEMTQEVFGNCECTFIIGTPGESQKTIQETIDFCRDHGLSPHAVFFLTPYPRTPLWEWMRKEGYFGSEDEWLDKEEELCLRLSDNEQGENLLVNFTDFSDEELVEIKEDMVQELSAWNKIKHQKKESK